MAQRSHFAFWAPSREHMLMGLRDEEKTFFKGFDFELFRAAKRDSCTQYYIQKPCLTARSRFDKMRGFRRWYVHEKYIKVALFVPHL